MNAVTEVSLPAKLFDTRTFLPSFCPSKTPTTRLRAPFPDRPKWSAAERRTSGATETFRVTRESVSAVVAGMMEDGGWWADGEMFGIQVEISKSRLLCVRGSFTQLAD
jgi:hypothetical protein